MLAADGFALLSMMPAMMAMTAAAKVPSQKDRVAPVLDSLIGSLPMKTLSWPHSRATAGRRKRPPVGRGQRRLGWVFLRRR